MKGQHAPIPLLHRKPAEQLCRKAQRSPFSALLDKVLCAFVVNSPLACTILVEEAAERSAR
jgi:hypothetical protein